MSATPTSGAEAPEATPRTPARRSRRRLSRGRIIALVVLLLLVVGVVLAVLARPLLTARSEAKLAQADLTAAKAALSAKDLPTARADVRSARAHVDKADASANGFGGDVWSVVPVAGGAVHDARHLIDALSETTSVAETGVQLYPMVSGGSSTLVRGQSIDLAVLDQVVSDTATIGEHLDRALADLDQVHGTTPVVGRAAANAKNTALGYLEPVKQSYDKAGPLVQSLPSIVGADGPRTYLLAMLNPAELRYSGGGALSFTTIHFDHGQATFGGTLNVDDINGHGYFQTWKPVPGNIFHPPGPTRVVNATFSPWWSVSGEELLRGYSTVFPRQHIDGVIGVDLQALANIFTITGPVDLPHFGTITGANLVQTLAGSYGDFASIQVRHQLNAELVPAFRQKFFEAGNMSDKLTALVDSADGRHFFTYFRNAQVQHRFAKVGLSGDLSPTPHDYIGVFTQNLNGSKTDYWQHRSITSHVKLNADGSAKVHLQVVVDNQAPPYDLPVPDPKFGYTTRYLQTVLGVFLPNKSRSTGVSLDGQPAQPRFRFPSVAGVHNRHYFHTTMMLNSGQSSTLDMSYTVPRAAEVGTDGLLTYGLAVDPQDTVVPETLKVIATWPAGYRPTSLPTGWKDLGNGTAELDTAVATKLDYAIPLARH
ncbi:DUF4012 domain-containing protein [Nocardioides cynanchi]|uniref:DUF4012 domain-containing protein n=1 Tax=Nocardioides cynanchi TaxID=2558918 RepID=UPI00124606C3|nr:DUF4012 domain-containing protein [Nocardioides cynanchi]